MEKFCVIALIVVYLFVVFAASLIAWALNPLVGIAVGIGFVWLGNELWDWWFDDEFKEAFKKSKKK